EQEWVFEDIPAVPTPSLFRGFSAPIRLVIERSREELAFLMAHDSDPFNRWDAGQELAKRVILELAGRHAARGEFSLDDSLVQAFRRVLMDDALDGSIRSLMMTPPSEPALAQAMDVVDPDALHAARRFFLAELGRRLGGELETVLEATMPRPGAGVNKDAIDRRRLHNLALALVTATGEADALARASAQFDAADNMTDLEAAFACLVRTPGGAREAAIGKFYERWKSEPLVLDKWFRIQAVSSAPDTFERVLELAEHPDFSLTNPNRVRALVGAFALANPVHFHRADGEGYRFLADKVLALDGINPQVASRMVSAFNPWRRFDKARQAKMKGELERIRSKEGLSRDVTEIVGRALAD
ncbi:MAG TPA: DUF3458 domain-containing protein, partial [Planctomycetes bacterium]|nr:DUF3458 domain-containing protein [Planctomycetota bacterium]